MYEIISKKKFAVNNLARRTILINNWCGNSARLKTILEGIKYSKEAIKEHVDKIMSEFKCIAFVEFTDEDIDTLIKYCNSITDGFCEKMIKTILTHSCLDIVITNKKTIIASSEADGNFLLQLMFN